MTILVPVRCTDDEKYFESLGLTAFWVKSYKPLCNHLFGTFNCCSASLKIIALRPGGPFSRFCLDTKALQKIKTALDFLENYAFGWESRSEQLRDRAQTTPKSELADRSIPKS